MRKLLPIILILLSVIPSKAQYRYGNGMDEERGAKLDSLVTKKDFGDRLDAFSSSRFYQMTYVGAPLVVSGLIAKGQDDHFRSLRNEYLPYFSMHADDYMPYVPVAIMLGLKSFGVESRSSWGRMLISDGFTLGFERLVIRNLKHITNVERPDGSNKHSFPSGHTANAFMTATMLTKEYGYISPWIGVGAYSLASATGLYRIANNKHWLSDVLTGAGIGILVTETGYYLADLIFKDKGLCYIPSVDVYDRMAPPSFFSIYLGMNIPLSEYDIDEENEFKTSSGASAGLEGAYFFNAHWGIGGRATVSNTKIILNKSMAEDNTLDAWSLCSGGYYSYPISSRWLAGAKLLGGLVHYPKLKLSDRTIQARDGFCMGSGVSATFRAEERYGMRFFLDYNLLPSHSRDSGEWMSTLTLGAAFGVNF